MFNSEDQQYGQSPFLAPPFSTPIIIRKNHHLKVLRRRLVSKRERGLLILIINNPRGTGRERVSKGGKVGMQMGNIRR